MFTDADGDGLHKMIKGIVERYNIYNQPQPKVIYVDRDCCSKSGKVKVSEQFAPWTTPIRLEIWYFQWRIGAGVITDSHVLYGTFMQQLTDCIFEWHPDDTTLLTMSK